MKRKAAQVLKDALELPLEARAALAGSLIDSLDDAIDPDAESAWEAEIAKRLREIDERRVSLVPWSEVRRRLSGG